ncbi:CHAT domain-containing protein, partial [Candidatus Pacearchaeota archaeon]|nr:CHAT domain-containing protein [Candidatus Pacearchaeota archaeon]
AMPSSKRKGLVRVSTSKGDKTKHELARMGSTAGTRNLRSPDMTAHRDKMSDSQEPAKLERYPQLDCPDKPLLDKRFSIFVQLLMEPIEKHSEAVIIEDTGIPEKPPEIEVVISAHGFDIEGNSTSTLLIDREDDSYTRFVLIPRMSGKQQIRVDLYQHGRRIGTMRKNVIVISEPEEIGIKQPDTHGSLEMRFAPLIPPPDLEIYVELDTHDNRTLYFRLHSTRGSVGYNHAKFGQVTLQDSPREKMQAIYNELSEMARYSGEDAQRRISTIGNNLWDELIPDKLKNEYWRFKSRVKSMLITSDEPWIPWEVMKPYRYNDDDERENAPFLCQQFSMSRWLSGPGTVDLLPVGVAIPVAPTNVNLAAVKEEVNFIEHLTQLNSAITGQAPLEARKQVLKIMETEKTLSILHFASHGGFDATMPDNSAITLSDGELRPSDIQTRFVGKRGRPLVFINACELAQMGFNFTGLGGWANKLVNSARVGAFAGAMWEVNDALALQFAKRFYSEFLDEKKTIAEAFRLAREEIQNNDPANSTWLAYVLYADPEGRIKE